MLLGTTIISILFHIWFTWVVYQCYRFFTEQCAHLSRAPANINYNSGGAYLNYPAYENQQTPKY